MARDDPQFRIRLPAELKARVERAAENNHRSLNAEIVAVLEQAFSISAPREGQANSVDEMLNEIAIHALAVKDLVEKTKHQKNQKD